MIKKQLKISVRKVYNYLYKEDTEDATVYKVHPKIIDVRDKLDSLGPYRFFGTLAFQKVQSERQAIAHAEKHFGRFQKQVLGKRWKRKGIKQIICIGVLEVAVIVSEKTKQTIRRRGEAKWAEVETGGYHFHFLIRDHPSLPRDDNAALIIVQNAYWKAAEMLKFDNGRQAVSRRKSEVKLVTNDLKLCEYLAKEAWHHKWQWGDRVFYM